MSINSWEEIIEKEKYSNNSIFRLNKWIVCVSKSLVMLAASVSDTSCD